MHAKGALPQLSAAAVLLKTMLASKATKTNDNKFFIISPNKCT
jgi:hypothetical protein